MTDIEHRMREAEALSLLTNRILMDYLSLQIDAGRTQLEEVKKLIGFSATEVIRGSVPLEAEVRFFEKVLIDRFDQTFANK